MAASAREWQKSANEINSHQPEPVITYDHMSDSNQQLYFSARVKAPYMYVILDSVIFLGMLSAMFWFSLYPGNFS
ncbi:MAG: hypothetical protein M3Q95_13490 [Bacteroidota bacterium]|nr:hypothetical protein [Bacteroidota bacterium]